MITDPREKLELALRIIAGVAWGRHSWFEFLGDAPRPPRTYPLQDYSRDIDEIVKRAACAFVAEAIMPRAHAHERDPDATAKLAELFAGAPFQPAPPEPDP